MSARDHFVYRAYDSEGRPLYVGCTGRPAARWRDHRATSDWFPYAKRLVMAGPYEKDVALAKEKEQIALLRPHFNGLPEFALIVKRHARRRTELVDQMTAAAGLSKEDIERAFQTGEYGVLGAIWNVADSIADGEFDQRRTFQGRTRAYRQLIGEVAA